MVRCSIRPHRIHGRTGQSDAGSSKKRMKDIPIGVVVFATIFGFALSGMVLGKILPTQHLSSDSRDAIRIVMILLATLSAVVPVSPPALP